jgi:hypothetical protein
MIKLSLLTEKGMKYLEEPYMQPAPRITSSLQASSITQRWIYVYNPQAIPGISTRIVFLHLP